MSERVKNALWAITIAAVVFVVAVGVLALYRHATSPEAERTSVRDACLSAGGFWIESGNNWSCSSTEK